MILPILDELSEILIVTVNDSDLMFLFCICIVYLDVKGAKISCNLMSCKCNFN